LRNPPGGPPIAEFDVLRSKVDSTFHLVHLAAKRAREINGYYAHLGEGLTQYIPPLMAVDSDKPLSIALEEIAAEKIVAVEPSEDEVLDPLSFIDMGGDALGGDALGGTETGSDDMVRRLSLITGDGDADADTGDSEPA
jgi:DNA-directed RNA polymerase subunit omega